MTDMAAFGRVLLILGFMIAALGLFFLIAGRIPGLDRLGRLPGDISVQRGPVTVFIPIVSSIVISIVLTVVLNLIVRR